MSGHRPDSFSDITSRTLSTSYLVIISQWVLKTTVVAEEINLLTMICFYCPIFCNYTMLTRHSALILIFFCSCHFLQLIDFTTYSRTGNTTHSGTGKFSISAWQINLKFVKKCLLWDDSGKYDELALYLFCLQTICFTNLFLHRSIIFKSRDLVRYHCDRLCFRRCSRNFFKCIQYARRLYSIGKAARNVNSTTKRAWRFERTCSIPRKNCC